MNRKTKLSLVCGGASATVLGILGGVMYYFAYTRSYDNDIHHFDFASAYPTLMTVFFALAVAISIATAFLMPKKYKVVNKAPDTATAFTLWFCAFVLLSFGLLSYSYNTAPHSDTAFGILCSNAAPILSALCCIPLVLSLSSRLRGTNVHAVGTFIPLFWCAAILFKYYFDISEMPLNDPELTLTVLSLSALGMFWLSECRLALGILSPAFAVISTLPAAAVTSAIAVARIIFYAKGGYVTPSIYENIPFLAIALLAAVRYMGIYASLGPKPETAEESDKSNSKK